MNIADKRGQVTIFIIIALVIVVLVGLLSYFWNDVKTFTIETNPQSFLETCLSDPIKNSVSKILLSGGVSVNKNYYLYNGRKIEFLCYTNEYYKTCVLQQPFLKDFISKEIVNDLRPAVFDCLTSLRSEMESKGYAVTSSSSRSDLIMNLSLNRMDFIIVSPLTFSKGESAQSFSSFTISKRSEVYSLIMSAVYILNWEARYGDFDTLSFMLSYPDLRLEKQKQSDGSKIYILSSRSTLEEFNFASRSISWPPGLSFNEVIVGDQNE
ncbi:MAG: hypothetical protein AABW73_02920 [Nanoarchaeota archaeon]